MSKPGFAQQITFLHTENLDRTKKFYSDILGLQLVRDQGPCLIFRVTDSAYLGFCEHIEPITPGRKIILTLISDDVDGWYSELGRKKVEIMEPPMANPKYQIYHFFLKDPDGYMVEIQHFNDPL